MRGNGAVKMEVNKTSVEQQISALSKQFRTDSFAQSKSGFFKIQKDTETGLYFNPAAEKPFRVDIRSGWDSTEEHYCSTVDEVVNLNARISSESQPFEKEVLNDLVNGSITQNMRNAKEFHKTATELISKSQSLPGLVSQLSTLTPQWEDANNKLNKVNSKAVHLRKAIESLNTRVEKQKPSWLQRNFPITKQAREKCAQNDKDALNLVAKRKTLYKLNNKVQQLSSEANNLSDKIKQLDDRITNIAPSAQKLVELAPTEKDILYSKVFPVCRNYERTSLTHDQFQQSKDTATRCLNQIPSLVNHKTISSRLDHAKDVVKHQEPAFKPIAPSRNKEIAV